MKRLCAACLAFLTVAAAAQAPPAVILVTLDGARIEEVFAGLDVSIVQSQLKPGQRAEDQALYKRYWAPTPEQRRYAKAAQDACEAAMRQVLESVRRWSDMPPL